MNKKRFKTLFKKNFKEEIGEFLPNTKISGLPDDYILRMFVIFIMYMIYAGLALSIFFFLSLKYVESGNDFSYFEKSSLGISLVLIVIITRDLISDYSKGSDIEILMTLPIKNEEIYLSRFFAIILSKFEVYLFYILMAGVYLFTKGFNLIGILSLIINFIPLIVIPIALVSIVVMLLMRFSNIRAYAGVFKYIGYGLGLLLIGLIYYYAFGLNDENALSNLGDILLSLSSPLSLLFFHTRIFAQSFVGGFLYLFLYSLILWFYNILILFILKKLSEKFYLDSFMNSRIKSRSKNKKNLRLKRKSASLAIFRKDFKDIISSPVYVFPILSSMIMLTILWGFGTTGLVSMLNDVEFKDKSLYFLIIIGAFVFRFFVSANDVAINSSLAREGEGLYQTLTFPISPRENIIGRLMSINLISFILNLGLTLVFTFMAKLDFKLSLCLLLGFVIASLLSSLQGLYMDSKSVNIHWDKEKELTKGSSANFGYYMISGFVILIVGVFAFIIYKFINKYLSILFIFFVIISLIVFLYKSLLKSYSKEFYDI